MKLHVHVHPGASKSSIGGSHDGVLVVRVRARAIDGAATNEVLELVASAFYVRHAAVRLLWGATSRRKVLEIDGEDVELGRRHSLLLGATPK